MINIIKYQLKGRKNTMILLLSIIGSVNVITWILEGFAIFSKASSFSPTLIFWLVISNITTMVIGIVLFFRCSSGHVDQLLYKDSNYLMLTVPRHGWEILGGRIVAGLIEFVAYAILATTIAFIHAKLGSILISQTSGDLYSVIGPLFLQKIVVNLPVILQMSLYGLCMFITTGVFLMFATVVSRSFIKNKGIATAITVVVFITVVNWSVNLGSVLSAKLNWFTTLTVRIPDFSEANGFLQFYEKTAQIPVTPFLLFLLLAALFFAVASWLLEKKVEI